MNHPPCERPPSPPRSLAARLLFALAVTLFIVLSAYLLAAYILMPGFWRRYAHRHPALDETPGITLTSDDHPGDPINVALIGSEDDVRAIMKAAAWFAADP